MGRRGHTTPADIAKTERLSFVMARRLAGLTFREIDLMMTPPVTAQAAHKAFWKVMQANRYDPARLRRRAARERALLLSDSLITGRPNG